MKTFLIATILILAVIIAYKQGQKNELKQAHDAIYQAFENSSDTWFFQNESKFFDPPIYEDDFLNGRCFDAYGETFLLKFYPKH